MASRSRRISSPSCDRPSRFSATSFFNAPETASRTCRRGGPPGARCANLDRKVGTPTPGKEADILLLTADRLSLWPLNNAPGVVVNQMNPGDVDTVFIAGKVKKWRGNLVGVDVPRVLRLVQVARDAVMRRAGFAMNLFG